MQQLLESGIQDMWLQEFLKKARHLRRHKLAMNKAGRRKIRTKSVTFKPLTILDLKVLVELFLALSVLSGAVVLGEICLFICTIQLDRYHQSA